MNYTYIMQIEGKFNKKYFWIHPQNDTKFLKKKRKTKTHFV